MYKFISDEKEFPYSEFFLNLTLTELIGIDTETTSLDVFLAKWTLLQIGINDVIYILDCRSLSNRFITYIISLLQASGKPIIAHNSKYDLKIIKLNTGILLTNVLDTMLIESFLFKGLGKVFYSLKELVEKYCGVILDKDVRSEFENPDVVISEEVLQYSAKDVIYLPSIYRKQKEQILQKGLEATINLEMKLVPVVVAMELAGVLVDKDSWLSLEKIAQEQAIILANNIKEIIISKVDFGKYHNGIELCNALSIPIKTKKERQALESLSGEDALKDIIRTLLNIDSHAQIKKVLTVIFNFDIVSTNEKVLKDLQDTEIIPVLLDYRENVKKVTTYGHEWINKHIHPLTGRVHSDFIQNGTNSGRGSSENPNLQNIPAKRKETDLDYRKPFVARPGYSLLAMDYSQQEYRLAGAISGDPKIIEAYMMGKDMHTATASIIFDVPLSNVTKEQRSFGKTMNFAVLYGSTEYGLAFTLKIDVNKARDFLDRFYSGYSTLTEFKRRVEEEIWTRKYSSTLIGRKRYFENKTLFLDGKEATRYESTVKREGFNHIIQGTGADVTKDAMIRMFYNNPFGEDKYRILMQIHDEIVVEVSDTIIPDATEFTRLCMIDSFTPFLNGIPAVVEGEAKKYWSK